MPQSVILVVEDNPPIRKGIVDALRLAGFKVSQCGRGDEAAERMLEMPLDLVLLDVMLPGVDGFTLLEEVRRARPRIGMIFPFLPHTRPGSHGPTAWDDTRLQSPTMSHCPAWSRGNSTSMCTCCAATDNTSSWCACLSSSATIVEPAGPRAWAGSVTAFGLNIML